MERSPAPGAGRWSQRVGERLRSIRRQRSLTLVDVETATEGEFRVSALGAYERGERMISLRRLARLADFYAVPVEHLLPDDVPPAAGPSGDADELDGRADDDAVVDVAAADRVVIDLRRLDRLESPEREWFELYLTSLRNQRAQETAEVMAIRRADLRCLALMMATSPDALVRRLADAGIQLS